MKKITRTIPTCTIFASKVGLINGAIEAVELAPLTVFGEKVTNEKALKLITKEYGKKENYIVTEIDVKDVIYEMDIDDFISNATIIEL